MARQRTRTLTHWLVLVGWLAALLPVATFPARALAEERGTAGELGTAGATAVSADAAEEIVYIDTNGFVRVFDPTKPADGVAVDWVSPEGGWRSFALGDFNYDGDKEIVAIKGSDNSDSKLVIWDPVISKDVTAADPKTPNGIPWRKLYEAKLGDKPELVAAADFDPGVSGDEILYVRRLGSSDSFDPGDEARLTIIKQSTSTSNGTSWVSHVEGRDFEQVWSGVYAGPLDQTGGAEWVLVDEDGGKLEAYTLDGGYRRLLDTGGTDKKVEAGIFANYVAGGNNEIAFSRDVDPPLPSLIVSTYTGGTSFQEVGSEEFRSPNFVPIFAGDINGSGDDELILMRTKADLRLVVRNKGGDGVIKEFLEGLPLDDDDGYRAGAAGDVDGDGRDEIVIMRDNKIRIYYEANASTLATDYSLPTNRRNIATGDLDRNGFGAGAQFGANVSQINDVAYVGYTKQGVFTVGNATTEEGIPFVAAVIGNPPWLTVTPVVATAPAKGSTPLEMTYTVNTSFMTINQVYTATIQLIATDPAQKVVNSPFLLPVTIRSEIPPLTATPAGSTVYAMPCQEPLVERTLNFDVAGFKGAVFKAEILDDTQVRGLAADGSLYWAEAAADGTLRVSTNGDTRSSTAVTLAPVDLSATAAFSWTSHVPYVTAVQGMTNTLPALVTVTVSPTLRYTTIDRAILMLTAPNYSGPYDLVMRAYPIWLVCSDHGAWLPAINRQ